MAKQGLSRAGLASSGVGMGVGCPWGPAGGGTSLLPQRSHWWSLMPPAHWGVVHKPTACYRAEFGGSASGGTNGGTAIPIAALVGPSQEDAEFSPLGPLTPPGQFQAPAQQWGHMLGSRAGPGAALLTLCYQTQGNHTFQIYLS